MINLLPWVIQCATVYANVFALSHPTTCMDDPGDPAAHWPLVRDQQVYDDVTGGKIRKRGVLVAKWAVILYAVFWHPETGHILLFAFGVAFIILGATIRRSALGTLGKNAENYVIPEPATSICPEHGQHPNSTELPFFDATPYILRDIEINRGLTCPCYFDDSSSGPWGFHNVYELVRWRLEHHWQGSRGHTFPLVKSGLYRYIRHPMYLGSILALIGSWIITIPPAYAWMQDSILAVRIFPPVFWRTLLPDDWAMLGSDLDVLLERPTWADAIVLLSIAGLARTIFGYTRIARTEEKAMNWEFREGWRLYRRSVRGMFIPGLY